MTSLTVFLQDETHYQRSISSEMEGRLDAKCDRLVDIFATAELGTVRSSNNVKHFVSFSCFLTVTELFP